MNTLAMVPLLPSTPFDFQGDEFYVALALEMPTFQRTDVYQLTGHLAEDGGMVTAKCLNETGAHRCSHSIHFTKAFHFPKVSGDYLRNISAMIGGKRYSGRALFVNMTRSGKYVCTGIVYKSGEKSAEALLQRGPNRPPRPPPVPQCNGVFNQTGCAKLTNASGSHLCVWCKSADDVHELCFTKGHTPNTGWSCDQNTALVV
jgi:hypothetical protein